MTFSYMTTSQPVTTSIGGRLGRWRPTGLVVRSRILDCFPLYIRVVYLIVNQSFDQGGIVFVGRWTRCCCREVRSPEVRAPVVTAVLLCSSQQSASSALRDTASSTGSLVAQAGFFRDAAVGEVSGSIPEELPAPYRTLLLRGYRYRSYTPKHTLFIHNPQKQVWKWMYVSLDLFLAAKFWLGIYPGSKQRTVLLNTITNAFWTDFHLILELCNGNQRVKMVGIAVWRPSYTLRFDYYNRPAKSHERVTDKRIG